MLVRLSAPPGSCDFEETSETNNTKYCTVKIGADLSIPTLTAPSSGTGGQTTTVTATIQNGSIASPTGAFVARLYWSTNLLLDANDTELGNCTITNLGAGESASSSFPVILPSVTSRAVYYLIAKADADGVLAETSESNNTRSRSILVSPWAAGTEYAAGAQFPATRPHRRVMSGRSCRSRERTALATWWFRCLCRCS